MKIRTPEDIRPVEEEEVEKVEVTEEELRPHEGVKGIPWDDFNKTLLYFKREPQLVWTLMNIRYHIETEKYDYPLVICGDTGTGKSMLNLHIIELWYRVILDRDWNVDRINHLKNTRKDWIRNFQILEPLDINANDEGADGITSKESMTRFGKDLQKLYMVFRKKFFFTIILIPDFFDLPLYFRKRIRGVIWVKRRGIFRFYTQLGIKWLNALNESKDFKSMDRARFLFEGTFPDYVGLLRKPYDDFAQDSPNKILNEMLSDIEDNEGSSVDANFEEVKKLIEEGVTAKDIAHDLGISTHTISKVRKRMKNLEKYELVKKNNSD